MSTERAKLNTLCLKFKDLQGARTMSRVGSLSPQSILLEPAVQAATELLISFPEHDTRGSLEMVFSVAHGFRIACSALALHHSVS